MTATVDAYRLITIALGEDPTDNREDLEALRDLIAKVDALMVSTSDNDRARRVLTATAENTEWTREACAQAAVLDAVARGLQVATRQTITATRILAERILADRAARSGE